MIRQHILQYTSYFCHCRGGQKFFMGQACRKPFSRALDFWLGRRDYRATFTTWSNTIIESSFCFTLHGAATQTGLMIGLTVTLTLNPIVCVGRALNRRHHWLFWGETQNHPDQEVLITFSVTIMPNECSSIVVFHHVVNTCETIDAKCLES